jgi:hypothetical protein
MLGRRSSLIGALVQAINIAIHETIERRSPGSRNQPVEIAAGPKFNTVKEVIASKE